MGNDYLGHTDGYLAESLIGNPYTTMYYLSFDFNHILFIFLFLYKINFIYISQYKIDITSTLLSVLKKYSIVLENV